jgi:hypothetical protein
MARSHESHATGRSDDAIQHELGRRHGMELPKTKGDHDD